MSPVDNDKAYNYYPDIMEKFNEQLEYMRKKHSKVLPVRFDLKYPSDNSITPDIKHTYRFKENLTRFYKREKADPVLLCVEEQNKSTHPHYHCLLLLNGNIKQKYFPVVEKANELWQCALKVDNPTLVTYCDDHGKNGIMIRRNSAQEDAQVANCYNAGQYLAKTFTKEKRAKGAWKCTGSRISEEEKV